MSIQQSRMEYVRITPRVGEPRDKLLSCSGQAMADTDDDLDGEERGTVDIVLL